MSSPCSIPKPPMAIPLNRILIKLPRQNSSSLYQPRRKAHLLSCRSASLRNQFTEASKAVVKRFSWMICAKSGNLRKSVFSYMKAWSNWTTLLADMSVIMLVECWSIFHVVHTMFILEVARSVRNLLLFLLF